MAAPLATQGLASGGLPGAWAGHPAWTVLDTDFQDGHHFLSTWLAWRHDPYRPRLLHYVGIAPATAPRPATAPLDDEWDTLAHALAAQCTGLGPGFHRILLEQGQISLTLCRGDLQAMLGEQVFQADTVVGTAPPDKWAAQLLARRCKRGTRFALRAPAPAADAPLLALLQGAGFQLDRPDPDPAPPGVAAALTGTFDPRWDIPARRNADPHAVRSPTRCAVIGAGMAGASVAQALALRGWQVTVFDQEAAPAGAASGVPVGLAVPHVSADDNPRSRISRSGTRLLLQHAQRLLVRGQDWEPSGVLERKRNAPPHWHPQAAWIKPDTLVRAWLAQPGITFIGNTKVGSLQRTDDALWLLQDAQGREHGRFAVVVLANALGCSALLKGSHASAPTDALPGPELQDKLAALQAVHGTLSHGTYAEEIPGLPATPVNGNGCFIPHVPDAGGEQWVAGSTFETDALAAADLWAQHAANLARLQHLLPPGGAELAETLDRGPVALWSATRCVTHDRLPLVGPIDTPAGSGLWLCVGMGSRGLSFTALCAELLAARLGAEPLPVEFSLSRSLDANRVRRLRPVAAKPTPAAD